MELRRLGALPPTALTTPPAARSAASVPQQAADGLHIPSLPRRGLPATAVSLAGPAVLPPLSESIARLRGIESSLSRQGDRRAVFVTTYLEILQATQEAVRTPGQFEDPATVEREAQHFVKLYLDAHDAYERGDREHVPAPWLEAFELATSGHSLAVENLLLGINAHVNYDLPRALAAAGAHSPANERDFAKFNDLLFGRMQTIKDTIIDRYTRPGPIVRTPALRVIDRLSGPLDDLGTKLMFTYWRNRAWRHRDALVTGEADAESRINRAAMRNVHIVRVAGYLNPFKDYLLRRRLA